MSYCLGTTTIENGSVQMEAAVRRDVIITKHTGSAMTDEQALTLHKQVTGVARSLSYNGETQVAQAKHLLFELQSALGERIVKAIHTADGIEFMNGNLRSRKPTRKERILFSLFGTLPRKL